MIIETGYRMTHHRPKSPQAGFSLDDLSGCYPADIYDEKVTGRYYDTPRDILAILKKTRGRPLETVTIFRAVPLHASDRINTGDWVTLSKEYAEDHGAAYLAGGYKVISQQVKAREVFFSGDSIHEAGYWQLIEKGEAGDGEPEDEPQHFYENFIM